MIREVMQELSSYLQHSIAGSGQCASRFSGYVFGPSLAAAGGGPRKPARPRCRVGRNRPG